MKVTARDIAQLVRDAQVEMMRKRSAEPKASLIDALINDEVNRLTSLVGEEEGQPAAAAGQGSQSLDPSHFVDTSSWTNDLLESTDGRRQSVPPGGARVAPPPKAEVDGLSNMLEPDRTGVHDKRGGKGLMIGIVVAVIVALVAAGVVVTQVL